MSFDSVWPIMNGHTVGNGRPEDPMEKFSVLNDRLKPAKDKNGVEVYRYGNFHGDTLLADKQTSLTGILLDLRKVLTLQNAPAVSKVILKKLAGKGVDETALAQLVGSMPIDSALRASLIQKGVQEKYDKMLHPPLTYLGDAFQYRAPDGKFNSVLHPHLGQAGAPYAKSVPSKTHPLGALPDPGDVFDRLMARKPEGRNSPSGLSSMLIYHATIIIHDIFRTNDSDKNISDSSSYLDLSPLYGYTMEMQRNVRDNEFKLGLLKPDTFAEDRLLRQPPGVCIYLVMYNRYHNYAARQLKRINENGRFSVPTKFDDTKLLAIAASRDCIPDSERNDDFKEGVEEYEKAWRVWEKQGQKPLDAKDKAYDKAEKRMRNLLEGRGDAAQIDKFEKAYEAAWDKLDDDLFNTARLITCGMYVNISIHDYLRALMGFHQYNTNFTLDPRVAMDKHKNVSRGLGNQVTVEFNLLYRFHCAISQEDEKYTEKFMKETMEEVAERAAAKQTESKKASNSTSVDVPDPKSLTMMQFAGLAAELSKESQKDPWLVEFGLKNDESQTFKRNTITGLFDDQKMINQLRKSMDDPISQFGPRNVPRSLKNVEIMGILQARKCYLRVFHTREIGTLNDFRDFFGLGRHESFEKISQNPEIQNALRDLYDHPDKVELYPGIFCESFADMGADPGPSGLDSALWAAIFSDAITLVRSDRFYTVDWNTNSLTSWGMKEVTPDDTLKSSVFHRLLQRAFPEWYPYDSIRFFHPFYTSQTNAKYAIQQGYGSMFQMTQDTRDPTCTRASDARKPHKPLVLTRYDDIRAVLATGADEIIHPAYTNYENLPKQVQEALLSIKTRSATAEEATCSPEDTRMTKAYFAAHMRAILEREAITMSDDEERGPIYQVDVTRDVAIPVITRCIADFLGFGDQIRSIENPKAKYSENEIYQHITNCQVFLSYNADETKLLKRRTAFKESMEFLLTLAEGGNILEASRWGVVKTFRGLFKATAIDDHGKASESMRALGRSVAATILREERDTGKAAAILLLTALDVAYISVLAFTAVLDRLLQGAYDSAQKHPSGSSDWFEIQKLAMTDDDESDETIQVKILEAQRQSVKLPFIRKVVKDGLRIPVNGKEIPVAQGQTIVCDIYEAMKALSPGQLQSHTHLNYISSLSRSIIHFNPKTIALHALTAMIKTMAQLKNLRRGHTSQGFVKKIEIDQTYEGYANFMAPGRMQMIAHDAKISKEKLRRFEAGESLSASEEKSLRQRVEDAEKVFSEDVLKPKADTYLTAEWDEMVPFPTTWKIRFDGYGTSDYMTKDGRSMLRPEPQPDSFPPFYQPQGASHWGGTFGEKVPDKTPADMEDVKTKGCGVPVPSCLH
ncbi:MAG: hypothetical protein Q9218_001725 [Villophora microphyllina]